MVILKAEPDRGGAERYTADLAAALVKAGHAVSVLARTVADGGAPADVEPVVLPTAGATRTRRYARFLDALDDHLSHARYDVVHAMLPVRRCDVYHPHAGLAAGPARKWNAVFNPRRRAMAKVERGLLTGPRPPVVLSLSQYVAGDVGREYPGLSTDRRVTLLNGIDLSRYARPPAGGPRGDRVTALIVANDFARKGLRQAIEAAARLTGAGLRLVVVGRDDPSPYTSLARRLGADVEWAGPSADVRPWYARADVLVLPTRHDPCSLVVLEALASGVPVVSTRFNGACEYMTDGVHGFVLPDPDDVDALARALRALLDPSVRQRMSDACAALRPALSYETHLAKLLAVYEQARPVPAGTGGGL